MLVDSSNSTAGSAVIGAIRQAAQATGTSFQYLLATAQVESGLNPQAGASTSSARGLFQFIEQTWLATIKQSGTELGYGQYADAITKDASGKYEVQDPTMRSAILKLRNDPAANAAMAGAFTKENTALLAQKLGRTPSEGELYIAHFLGVGGAAKLITAAADNPNASAASLFPSAAQANSSIFYDHTTGAPRTLAQVRDVLTARYDVAARERPVSGGTDVAQATTAPSATLAPASVAASANTVASGMPTADAAKTAAAIVPDTAGVTSAFAAATPPSSAVANTDVFHSLFSDPGRTTPIASVVSQLWVTGSSPNAMNDLFKDDGKSG
jgi:Transglycosylase SLT domain